MSRWPNLRQKEATFSRIGYTPNLAQRPVHWSGATVVQVVGAEGGGKSAVAAAEMMALLPWCELIYLVGQTYTNSVQEFEVLESHLRRVGSDALLSVSKPKHGQWVLETATGCRVVTLSVERGAASVISLGQQPDLIVLCEAGIISSYSVLLASVRRATRARGRVLLAGTLRDDFGWYAALVDELSVEGNAWRGETFSLPAWGNLHLYPGGRDDPEIKRLESILPEGEFARTVAAERRPAKATIFPEFTFADHMRECPLDPELPVTLWVDPGYFPSAYAVLPVQFHGDEVWMIDEVYEHYQTHQEIIARCKKKEWWGQVEDVVLDHAARQHHATVSAMEVWQATGLGCRSQPVGILDGIMRHRTFLKNPATGRPRLFHDAACVNGAREYKRYRRPSDRDGNPIADKPLDKDNHVMKAIAYGLVDRYGFVDVEGPASATVPARDVIEEMDRAKW